MSEQEAYLAKLAGDKDGTTVNSVMVQGESLIGLEELCLASIVEVVEQNVVALVMGEGVYCAIDVEGTVVQYAIPVMVQEGIGTRKTFKTQPMLSFNCFHLAVNPSIKRFLPTLGEAWLPSSQIGSRVTLRDVCRSTNPCQSASDLVLGEQASPRVGKNH